MKTPHATADSRSLSRPPPVALVTIPANNEAERIGTCLAALARQRDRYGAPLPVGSFEILVFANNCTDGTLAVVSAMVAVSPYPISVVSELLGFDQSNAGWARKASMDWAAARLEETGQNDGVILTTDADSIVAPTWVSATLDAFAGGADCIAGYIDADPAEILELGSAFLQRSRLEDRYLRTIAEIYARCDPRPHDPWPNHRVSSGASLALTLDAYRAIGGLPVRAVGEDSALTHALECAGFKVRHATDVCVSTSCRFDGRAKGGAADTMRYRHSVEDAPCDDECEPALVILRRALYKGALRRLRESSVIDPQRWGTRLGLQLFEMANLLAAHERSAFESFWTSLVAASPVLTRAEPLRPSDLPRQTERAEAILHWLTWGQISASADRDGRRGHSTHRETISA